MIADFFIMVQFQFIKALFFPVDLLIGAAGLTFSDNVFDFIGDYAVWFFGLFGDPGIWFIGKVALLSPFIMLLLGIKVVIWAVRWPAKFIRAAVFGSH